MPWVAVDYSAEETRKELATVFGVKGIPTLVITEADTSVITYDGRGEVNDDPEGLDFPWRPRLVNLLTERQASKLQDNPAVVLFIEGEEMEMEFARSVLTPAAKELHHHEPDEQHLDFFIACDSETGDTLREFLGLDEIVPLLTIVNIPEGTWTVMEEDTELDESVVKEWVAQYLQGQLNMQSIVRAPAPTAP